ncbi:hypothetical protein P7C73_g4501, partial [Tremellales sp. Uapishka_1]
MPRQSALAIDPALPFPTEVLSLISNSANRSSLAACCTVTRAIHDIAAPILYRFIVISSVRRRDSRFDADPKAFSSSGRVNPHTRKRRLLLHAEEVTVELHHEDDCPKPLKFPKLHTLRLELGLAGYGPTLHYGGISEKQCVSVKALKPKRLVLRGASICNIQQYPAGFGKTLYTDLEELVFVCPNTTVRPNSCSSSFHGVEKLKGVVWIFLTRDPKEIWRFGTETVLGRHASHGFMTELASFGSVLCDLPLIPIIIVNGSAVEQGKVFQSTSDAEKQFATTVYSSLQWGFERDDRSPPSKPSDLTKRIDEKFALIKFLSMEQYISDHQWQGVLEEQEIQGWIGGQRK